jgi:hypothetical protein
MRNLGRTAYARFRAEQAAERACRYIRNEGREVVLRGDLTQVDKMIASIRLISPPADREGFIADVRRQVSRVQAGFSDKARVVSSADVTDWRNVVRAQNAADYEQRLAARRLRAG